MPQYSKPTIYVFDSGNPEADPAPWRGQEWYALAQELGVAGLIENSLLDPRFNRNDGSLMAHAINVREGMEAQLGPLPAPLGLAVMCHDLVGRRGPSKLADIAEGFQPNQEFIDTYVAFLEDHQDKAVPQSEINKGLYALGVAVSANQVESCAELWRQQTLNELDPASGLIEDTPERIRDTEEQITAIVSSYNGQYPMDPITPEQVREQLQNVLRSGKAMVPDFLLSFRANMADTSAIAETMRWDMEGLLIKGIEVGKNLEPGHRNEDRPGSAFRDAQELSAFYAALIEFQGLPEIASQLQSIASLYFYKNAPQEFFDQAKFVHESAVQYLQKHEGQIKAILARIQQQGASHFDYANPDMNIHANQPPITVGIPITLKGMRPKQEGSILRKALAKNNPFRNPDAIGMRIELPDSPKDDDLFYYLTRVADVINSFEVYFGAELGWSLDHPVGEIPIDVKISGIEFENGSQEPKESSIDYTYFDEQGVVRTKDYQLILGPAKQIGYEAVHVNFAVPVDNGEKIFLEAQIFSNTGYINSIERAPHALYSVSKEDKFLGGFKSTLIESQRNLFEFTEEFEQQKATAMANDQYYQALQGAVQAAGVAVLQAGDREKPKMNRRYQDLLHDMDTYGQKFGDLKKNPDYRKLQRTYNKAEVEFEEARALLLTEIQERVGDRMAKMAENMEVEKFELSLASYSNLLKLNPRIAYLGNVDEICQEYLTNLKQHRQEQYALYRAVNERGGGRSAGKPKKRS